MKNLYQKVIKEHTTFAWLGACFSQYDQVGTLIDLKKTIQLLQIT